MATLVDPPAPIAVGSRREQVLALLRAAEGALSVAEVADSTGLHVNTARFHLDGLVQNGLAQRMTEARDEPGRPRILYIADGPAPGPRSYALLAEMLTGLVASLEDAEPAAVKSGESWGRHLIERPAPSERVPAAEAVERLRRVLDAIGFQPQVSQSRQGIEVGLRHCPFREIAERHTNVVCSIHLGLMRGALTELGAPLEAVSLEPFARPNLCVARLRATKKRPVR